MQKNLRCYVVCPAESALIILFTTLFLLLQLNWGVSFNSHIKNNFINPHEDILLNQITREVTRCKVQKFNNQSWIGIVSYIISHINNQLLTC